jgi:hypothetical protein
LVVLGYIERKNKNVKNLEENKKLFENFILTKIEKIRP